MPLISKVALPLRLPLQWQVRLQQVHLQQVHRLPPTLVAQARQPSPVPQLPLPLALLHVLVIEAF
jgi:hypothetical protein